MTSPAKKKSIWLVFAALLVASFTAVWLSGRAPTKLNSALETPSSSTKSTAMSQADSDNYGVHSEHHAAVSHENELAAFMRQIQRAFDARQYLQASQLINDRYSALSVDDLAQIRTLFDRHSSNLRGVSDWQAMIELHSAETQVYDDLDAWRRLSTAAMNAEQWAAALDATLRTSLLENDSQRLVQLQNQLVSIASQVRVDYERQNDHVSLLDLYQRLALAHPNYPRFQLELAYSHLRLNQTDLAMPILEALQYDPKFGEISQSVLARLQDQQQSAVSSEVQSADASIETDRTSYRIPLQRLGTNLLAQVSANNQPLVLLLDTGASITALDSQIVANLGLTATSQRIRLSTANGVTEAQLYRMDRLKLGRFELRNVPIASIDLGSNGAFSGLLGTDVLNSLNDRYSYVIDNASATLLFREK